MPCLPLLHQEEAQPDGARGGQTPGQHRRGLHHLSGHLQEQEEPPPPPLQASQGREATLLLNREGGGGGSVSRDALFDATRVKKLIFLACREDTSRQYKNEV